MIEKPTWRDQEIVSQTSGPTAGAISRRKLMQQSAALGVTAASASTMMPHFAQASLPKKGGLLRVGIGSGSTTDSLDPGTFIGIYTLCLGFTLRNYLTEVDGDGQLVGELAESWEPSADAKTWSFKIRKGVEFHNGKTMSVHDVIASINFHRAEGSKSAGRAVVDGIETINADGKDRVTFVLKGGSADFPVLMSDYHLPIMPADAEGNVDWQSGVGTGPYVLENHEPGVVLNAKRNPNYWKEGRGHFDAIKLLTINDVVARTTALRSGQIDVMDRCDLKTLNLLERSGDIDILETSGTQHYVIPMRTDTAPFDNVDVRRALKYAIDREVLLQIVLRGHGTLGNDHPIAKSQRFFASELPQRQYDPDKAKFHLKKAGVDNLRVDLSASDAAFAGAVDAAVLYKEHAAKAGIDINVLREPSDGYWANVWMKKPWLMSYWAGRPTSDWMFTIGYSDETNWNDSFWLNDRFLKLLREARAELNEIKRREMYVEMQSIVRDDGGVVIPLFANYVAAKSSKIATPDQLGVSWPLDGCRLTERWWFS